MVVGSEGPSSRSLLFAMLRILRPLFTPVNFCDEAVIGPCPHTGWLPWLRLVLRPFAVVGSTCISGKFPDGTVVSTSPHGQTYTIHPRQAAVVSRQCRPTAAVTTFDIPHDTSGTATSRGLMMPRRKQTRTQQRATNIADQRRLNEPFAAERIAERNKPPPF